MAIGKAILLGEHFVVHGVHALAVPLAAVSTSVTLRRVTGRAAAGWDDPTLTPAELALAELLLDRARARLGAERAFRATACSTIPRGRGLGSSAALAVALVGALGRAAGHELAPEQLREHAHALEELVHGTPSGIDDATVAWRRPLAFRRGGTPVLQASARAITLVLSSAGQPAPTREAVARVAARRAADLTTFTELCRAAAGEVAAGRAALQRGDAAALGATLDAMHELLAALGVSTPGLERLVAAARGAGALGAKLTGAGLGGFMLALAPDGQSESIAEALRAAGGQDTFTTIVAADAAGDAAASEGTLL